MKRMTLSIFAVAATAAILGAGFVSCSNQAYPIIPDGGADLRPADLAISDMRTNVWQVRSSGIPSITLNAVWGTSSTNVYVVGAPQTAGSIYHSTNDGVSWTAASGVAGQTLQAIWGSSATDIYAVGNNCTILHSTDGGVTWPAEAVSGCTDALYGVWGADSTHVYAVGGTTAPLTLARTNGTWSAVPSGHTTVQPISAIWGASASAIYLGTQNDTINDVVEQIFQTNSFSITPVLEHSLTSTATGPHVRSIYGVGEDIYAVGDTGLILHTVNGGTVVSSGQSWLTYPSPTSNELEGVWVGVSAMPTGEPTTYEAWAVGQGGKTLHSIDDGITWLNVASATTVDLHGVWGSSVNDVWAVGDNGIVMHY